MSLERDGVRKRMRRSVTTVRLLGAIGALAGMAILPASAASATNMVGLPRRPSVTMIAGPFPQLKVGAQVGTSASSAELPVRVAWYYYPPDSPVCSTKLQRSVNGGPWTPVPVPSPTATGAPDTLPLTGVHYQYEVDITNCNGWTTGWVAGLPFGYDLLQESAPQWQYSRLSYWNVAACAQCSQGHARYTTSLSVASAVLTLPSVYNVGLVMETGPTRGSAYVLVDGKVRTTINTNSATVGYRLLEFKATWPTSGHHTIRVMTITSGNHRTDIDAAVVLGGP